ncbi:hypothetical protein V6N11_035591 [Hibiscus sabdariffa]|uniref:Uncharacterized protein n=1 Tax=Hibiscus sabdariffa TaxID=183260 RepID=A0ABR2NMS8_9ROSI
MWLLLWHVRWRYEAPIWSTAYTMWAARAWPPDSPWTSCRSTEADRGAVDRHGRFLTPISNVGLLVLFLTRFISQGFPVRSLDSLLIGPPFVPWMNSCFTSLRRFSSVLRCPCGYNFVACSTCFPLIAASVSHRGLTPTRAWWVLIVLCVALVPWHAMRDGFCLWVQHCTALAPWCVAVRCELDVLHALWWPARASLHLPHQGVRCKGLLRRLAPATRAYGLGCAEPCLVRGFLAHSWSPLFITWLYGPGHFVE